MATPTYDLLDSTTLASSAASVSFSSIDQSYRDLVLVCNYVSNGSLTELRPSLNNDTSSSYPYVLMTGNGSTASSSANTTTYIRTGSNAIASGSSSHLVTIQINDYSATDKHKPILVRGGNTATYTGTEALAVRWENTAAVNEIDCLAGINDFASGSTFYLYGVAS